jgi:DNA-binding HxlR family transcriptional regulator
MASRKSSDRKSFGQFCPVARALDVVGDRWTLLILRELLGGPARFGELQEGLQGIAKNLLVTRLRRLEDDGVVRRLGTASTSPYALTEHGEAIRGPLEQLAFWGTRVPRVSPPVHRRSLRAIAMALHSILVRAQGARGSERRVIEVEADGEPMEIVLGPQPSVTVRPVSAADVTLRTSSAALSAYLNGEGLVRRELAYVSGAREVRTQLLDAMASMA